MATTVVIPNPMPITGSISGVGVHVVGGGAANGGAGTIFSTASNQYAILTFSGSGGSVTIGGVSFASPTSNTSVQVYVPPSTLVSNSSLTGPCVWTIFQNV